MPRTFEKLFIDCSNRYQRKVVLYSPGGKENKVEGDEGVLGLVDRVLSESKTAPRELTQIKAKLTGQSRVGILIGAAAADALNYCLGLKGPQELEFPKEPESGF